MGSLREKLGLKDGMSTQFIHAPSEYFELIGKKPSGYNDVESSYDFIHAFYSDKSEVEASAWILSSKLHENGVLWVSWPKQAATDITEQELSSVFKGYGLAQDESLDINLDWQALKFIWK